MGNLVERGAGASPWKRTEKKAAKGFRLWDTDSWEEDCVAAVAERQLHRFLSRACAFAIVCFTDPWRGLVFRFTGDVHCLRGGSPV